jgi:predicted transcriptional regulator
VNEIIEHLSKEELVEYLKTKNAYLISKIEDVEKSGKGETQNAFEQLRHNQNLLIIHDNDSIS